MTGHVPKFGQKHPASVTTNTVIFLVRFRHKNHLISVTKKKVLLENIFSFQYIFISAISH